MEGDFQIGEWLVQPQRNSITNAGRDVSLEPKVMDVLVYLAQHNHGVVAKEEVIQAVWQGVFVTEDVLIHAISELRKAFQDDARNPNVIQTIPKRGYQLIAPVTGLDPGPSVPGDGSGLEDKSRVWQWIATVALTSLLLVAIGLLWHWSRTAPSGEGPIDSIAVLPFTSVGDDEDCAALADGIPQSISSSLSGLSQLTVKPSFVLLRYRGKDVDPRSVSEELGIRAVLTGTVQRHDNTLLVRVELIDGRQDRLVWGQTYTRDLSEILELEEDIARQIAQALRRQLSPERARQLAKGDTQNPEARLARLRGRYHYQRQEFSEAAFWNRRAVEIDPSYQRAYYALGWSYFLPALRQMSQESQEPFAQARTAWEKLIKIDDSTALAHWCRAWILFSYEKDWKRAEMEFRWAKEVDPEFKGEPWFYEVFLDWMGRREERLAFLEMRLERADPLSPDQQEDAGWAFLWSREYDRAIEQAKKAIALQPESAGAYWILSRSYQQKGMSEEAFAALLESARVSGRSEEQLRALQKSFQDEGLLGVEGRAGFRKLVSKAMYFAQLNEKDQAFELLRKIWEFPLGGWEWAPSNPFLDPLRSDPRFEQLLRNLNLPEEAIQRHLALPSR